jgi:para-aminobenzoate synthetase/4-amino-4-deoxychorismate lyase
MPDPRAGVFETLLVQHGLVVNADEHLSRLTRSVRELYDVPVDGRAVKERLLEVASSADGCRRVRLTFRPDLAEVELSTVEIDRRPEGPWYLVPRDLPGGLGRHKWVDRQALDALRGPTWAVDTDPLLTDQEGQVLETGRGNVFLVVRDVVSTPRDDGRILPGVVRSQVLDLLRRRDVRIREVELFLKDVGVADDVFVTNSIGGLRPVAECSGVGGWRPGALAAQIRSDLEGAWHPPSRDPEGR